jgi:hypothetical protein
MNVSWYIVIQTQNTEALSLLYKEPRAYWFYLNKDDVEKVGKFTKQQLHAFVSDGPFFVPDIESWTSYYIVRTTKFDKYPYRAICSDLQILLLE